MRSIKTYLSFRIGNYFFAVNVSHIHNIIEYCKITKVPAMPDIVLGMINLRGIALPVINTHRILKISDCVIDKNTCIIVAEFKVDKELVMLGMLVDAVSEVLEIEDFQIKDPPKIGSKMKFDLIEGVFHNNQNFIMILNMDKMLHSQEVLNIEINC
jgi:purine-binding chemotaxis protein CheW